MLRIGLLTGINLSNFRLQTLKPILKDNYFSIKVVIIDKRRKKTLIQKLLKNIRRGRGGYIIIMVLKKVFSKKEHNTSTIEFCHQYYIEFFETKRPYSEETIERIKTYNLDVLLLIGGFGIVKQPLLTLTPFGVLSYHHGNMRKYRGMPPAFWELYNNEKEIGVTVQILDAGVDCGIPIEEKKINIIKKDTLKTLQKRMFNDSIDMMYKALKKLTEENYVPEKIETFGKLYTMPNLRQWLILNLKIFFRRL